MHGVVYYNNNNKLLQWAIGVTVPLKSVPFVQGSAKHLSKFVVMSPGHSRALMMRQLGFPGVSCHWLGPWGTGTVQGLVTGVHLQDRGGLRANPTLSP